jgi:hypothetical protein
MLNQLRAIYLEDITHSAGFGQFGAMRFDLVCINQDDGHGINRHKLMYPGRQQ